ncbi:MAG: PilZ domain-containing protein [Xanthobacteraceae bacterium]
MLQEIETVEVEGERRRFQRVRVNLLGRYMMLDRREFPCQVIEMSPGDMVLIAPQIAAEGERVIAYIDHLGRLEGSVARTFENGFAVRFASTERKRDKLASQLTWLANRDLLTLEEDRRHDRIAPEERTTTITMPNGINLTCRLLDTSQSGAAVVSTERPPVGALVGVGKLQARVVRHLDDGFAVEFTRLQHLDFLDENLSIK